MAACAIAGLPTWRLRVEVAALRRIAAARARAPVLAHDADPPGPGFGRPACEPTALARRLADEEGPESSPDPAEDPATEGEGSGVELRAEAGVGGAAVRYGEDPNGGGTEVRGAFAAAAPTGAAAGVASKQLGACLAAACLDGTADMVRQPAPCSFRLLLG